MKTLEIYTNNTNPNFTIVLPGPCQANCDFCFWKREDSEGAFLKSLKRVLKRLPSNFTQISISGGEPTLSPVFEQTMELINKYKAKGKFHKVVLTTNGVKLKYKDLTGIDHINISRHAVRDSVNREIFKTKNVPHAKHMQGIVNYVNKFGIDVNFNAVRTEAHTDTLSEWVDFARFCNVQSITFRNQYGNYESSPQEDRLKFLGYKPTGRSQCPVCLTTEYTYFGVNLKFHSSDYEPTESKAFDEREVYELVLHPTGDLARDWEAKKIILARKD